MDEALNVLEDYKKRNPNADIEYKLASGDFNRAVGLHMGISMVSFTYMGVCVDSWELVV